MAALSDDSSPIITEEVLNLVDLGITEQSITPQHITMASDKYVCIKETSPRNSNSNSNSNSVVIIDMTTKPVQPLRVPIAPSSAVLMNPRDPILALKGGTTQDHIQILNIEAESQMRTMKTHTMAEKVVYWKWITPKTLGLVTQRAVYHWSLEGLSSPVRMFDRSRNLATSEIINYQSDPSGKWLALIGTWHNPIFQGYRMPLGILQLFSVEHQCSQDYEAFAAAFTIFNNVEVNDTASTLLCFSTAFSRRGQFVIQLHVIEPGVQSGNPGFQMTQAEFTTSLPDIPLALQISQKYGLIYIITKGGLISIHKLETAEAIFSTNICDSEIIITTETKSSGSFYAINKRGKVLQTNVNDSTILSFLGANGDASEYFHALLATKGKLHDIQTSQQQMISEFEVLKMQKAEQQTESSKIIRELEQSLKIERKKRIEIAEQLSRTITELNNYQKSQESQQEMMNEMERLKIQNAKLKEEKDNIIYKLDEFHSWMEGFDSSNNYLEANFTEFTLAEIRMVTNNFNDSLKIGEGGYGSVYKAYHELKPVAIKILKQESRHGNKQFNQEVEILSKFRHPYIVMLLGACPEAQALVYELMPNGSLHDILRNRQRSNALTWKLRIRIAANICSALIFLHSNKPHGIVHGDIKSPNILLDSNYTGKLSDFGICRCLQKTDTRNTPLHITNYAKGTLPYMDPEIFSTGEITAQSDVYSFGIVLLELVTGMYPVVGFKKVVEDVLQKDQNFVDATAGMWPLEEAKKMVNLGLRCSDPSREKRPDLLKEVWVQLELMRRASLSI